METNFFCGTYNVPAIADNLSASYTVPGMISKELVEKIIAAENLDENSLQKQPAHTLKEESSSVTHGQFFGENIARVFKAFKK